MQQMQKAANFEANSSNYQIAGITSERQNIMVSCLGGTLCPLQPRQIPAICAFGTWSNFDGALLPRLMSSSLAHTHTHTFRMGCAFFQPQVLQLYSFCQQISNERRNERTGRAAWTPAPAPSPALAWAWAPSHKYIDLCVWWCAQKRKWNFCQLNYEHQMRFTLWCNHLSVYKSEEEGPASDSVLAKAS